MIRYKQLCLRCKKNRIVVTSRTQFPVCYDCQKEELHKEITDKKMEKFFDIPEEFYRKSYFLRSIKLNYLKFGKLSEKQIEWFNKVIEEMKKEKKN